MADPSTAIAHVVKLGVTVVCMKYFREPYSFNVNENVWAVRAFQILFLHSIMGVFRFGNPSASKYFRGFYARLSSITNTVPFALVVTEILRSYRTSEQIAYTLLLLTFVPIIYEFTSKERAKQYLIDQMVGLNLLALTFVCLKHGNYGAISLVASYTFTHYFLEEFSDRYDVPHRDLTQYGLCFMEIFTILTLKDI